MNETPVQTREGQHRLVQAQIETSRSFDPARGAFFPSPRSQQVTMRMGKTDRDHRSGAWDRLRQNKARRAAEHKARG